MAELLKYILFEDYITKGKVTTDRNKKDKYGH